MKAPVDGRRFAKELVALPTQLEADRKVLGAPMPGFYRNAPIIGARLEPDAALGELEVLGARYRLIVPASAHGVVIAVGDPERRLARRPVEYGEALITLDTELGANSHGASTTKGPMENPSGALTFSAPMSGRYYARPAPDAEAFVQIGGVIEVGQSVAVLEVMKTFNRVQYGGAGMPQRARILAILAQDGEDVRSGDPLFEIESV